LKDGEIDPRFRRGAAAGQAGAPISPKGISVKDVFSEVSIRPSAHKRIRDASGYPQA
jgi:hypothetical protein